MYERLRTRREFLATATGRKAARPAFVLQARKRGDDGPPCFGFTISKRVAKSAVERNRIRRRLKEAVRRVGAAHADAGCDYVLVGRRQALAEAFADLEASLLAALRQTSAAMRGGAGSAEKASG